MNETTPQAEDYEKPVAYDSNGNPLYARPADPTQPTGPVTVVHMSRPLEPVAQEISPELQAKHDKSLQRYPHLDLSAHEYVVLSVRRHIFGLIGPLLMTVLLASISIAVIVMLPDLLQTKQMTESYGLLLFIGVCVVVLLLGGMYALHWVYMNNTFFLTNESIIEKVQLTLFSSNVKSVGLGDVVDVSYRQSGLVEQLLNYGTVQVGTKDDEVPYIFSYVANPKVQASTFKDAVEAFKNGRPYASTTEN